jgi:hypothetical protein
MLSTTSILALLFALPAAVRGTQYGLVKEYAGNGFFDDWNFYGSCECLGPFILFPLKAAHASDDNLTNGNA